VYHDYIIVVIYHYCHYYLWGVIWGDVKWLPWLLNGMFYGVYHLMCYIYIYPVAQPHCIVAKKNLWAAPRAPCPNRSAPGNVIQNHGKTHGKSHGRNSGWSSPPPQNGCEMAIEIVDLPIENGGFPYLCHTYVNVYQAGYLLFGSTTSRCAMLCLCCRSCKGLIDRRRSCSEGLVLVARCAELKPQWTPCQGTESNGMCDTIIYLFFYLFICLSIFLYVRIHVHMSIFMQNFWVVHSSSWEWKVPSSTWRPSSAKLVWRRFSGARAHPKILFLVGARWARLCRWSWLKLEDCLMRFFLLGCSSFLRVVGFHVSHC